MWTSGMSGQSPVVTRPRVYGAADRAASSAGVVGFSSIQKETRGVCGFEEEEELMECDPRVRCKFINKAKFCCSRHNVCCAIDGFRRAGVEALGADASASSG